MDKVIFLDRDGTLNYDPGYIPSVDRYRFFPGVLDALSDLARHGCKFVIVTNQSGIARGIFNEKSLGEIHAYITRSFRERDIPLLGIYYCPHLPDDGCNCRKPRTGLFEQAANEHSIDLQESYIIGDSRKDMEAGKSLGMKTILVRTGVGRTTEAELAQKGVEVYSIINRLSDCGSFVFKKGRSL